MESRLTPSSAPSGRTFFSRLEPGALPPAKFHQPSGLSNPDAAPVSRRWCGRFERRAGWTPMLRSLVILWSLVIGPWSFREASAQQLFIEKAEANTALIDAMYVKGLSFLTKGQSEDGLWADTYGRQPGVLGLCIVAMLAHGDDPNVGPYALTIRRALNALLKLQSAETGYLGNSMYNHGFGTLALAEAYGAVDDARIGPALQRAVNLIVASQSRNQHGGWRYSPDSSDADTTVSGAQMVALFAARNAGLAVPEEAIQKGLKYFASCKTPEGGYGYTGATGPNAARCAIGVLVLALAKQKDTAEFKSAWQYLQVAGGESHYQQYFLYYGAQAYFHASPDAWRKWNSANIKALAASQNQDGSWEGSFGPAFGTAASLLSLALNYRFLPIYER